jgi:hypothetical protein
VRSPEMPTPMRPWTRRILDLIDAGVTDREEIIRLTTPFVPQGHAYRVRESTNERQRRRSSSSSEPRRLNVTPSEMHRIGARGAIRASLANQLRDGYLIRDGDQFRRARS